MKLLIDLIIETSYRPYVKKANYFDSEHRITHELYQNTVLFGSYGKNENKIIAFNVGSITNDALASKNLVDFAFLKFANGSTQCLPLYTYDAEGNRRENITDWALEKFEEHYREVMEIERNQLKKAGIYKKECTSPRANMEKRHIFHYVYAVLHDPAYRQKYELNLKRDFPRIPFYDDFSKWTRWGEELMDLHINYETVEPYRLEREDIAAENPKPKLKAEKENGIIYVDSQTTLHGIPEIAWEYKLGNRSALEWILDQYKEKKPKDATIAEKFNTYRFADYKESVIDLLMRVCMVSVKTMEIIRKLEEK